MNRRIVFPGALVASLICASCFAQVKGVPQTQSQSQVQTQAQIQTQARSQSQSQKQERTRNEGAQAEAPIVCQASQNVDVTSQSYGPVANWKVGDSWQVETTYYEEQGNSKGLFKIFRWVFVVNRVVSVLNRSAFEVTITSKDKTRTDPVFYMYVDTHSGALIRTTNSEWRFGAWRTRTENYAANGAAPTAAVVPTVPAVPVDVPVFPDAYVKALDYGSGLLVVSSENPEDAVAKDVSNVAPFAYRIQQRIEPITSDLRAKTLAKGIESKALENGVEVNIETGTRNVKQIWTPGTPWPVYSSDGVVEARLIVEK